MAEGVVSPFSSAVADESAALPTRSDIPGAPQGRAFLPAFVLANFGVNLALLTAAGITIPLKLAEIAPSDKARLLSVLAGLGGLAVMAATPMWGRLSDRSMSPHGMRRPLILGGSVAGTVALLGLAVAPTAGWMMIAWASAQMCFAATSAAVHALFADQVPARVRARVAAVFGLGSGAATIVGGQLVTVLPTGWLWRFGVPAGICLATSGTLTVVLRDRVRTHRPEPFGWRVLAHSYWLSPRRYPDFAWAWLCRLLVTMSIVTVATFMLYFLTDELGVPERDAPGTVSVVLGVYFLSGVLTTIGFAWLSDRTGHRKGIVVASALLTAVGLGVGALAPDVTVFLWCVVIAGMGQGAYVSVDVALMTEVLPSAEDSGKDLGLVSVAYLLPQGLLPVIAIPLLAIGADGGADYRALWFGAVGMALLGALAVLPIRSVR